MKAAQRSRVPRTAAKRSKAASGPTRPTPALPILHPHAAGIDVGATQPYVCVPADAVGAGESAVRSFGAFSGELDQWVEWLRVGHVTTVAMESTGVYWIPLFQKLEAAGWEVVRVKARHLKQVPGRKTDLKDCQWIQRWHSHGLLQGSFRPDAVICRLRYLPRLDAQTDPEYAAYKNRASFFNATARTADGFVGLILRREATVKLPDPGGGVGKALADFADDADMLGTSLPAYAKNVVTEVTTVGPRSSPRLFIVSRLRG